MSVTVRKRDWSGEQVKEQKKERKLPRAAGQVARRGSACWSELESTSSCAREQQVRAAKVGPQTLAKVVR